MDESLILNGVLMHVATEAEEYVVPDGVTCIEALAFCSSWDLKSVKIPESVKYIGSNAFAVLQSLTRLELPSNLDMEQPGGFGYISGIATSADLQIIVPAGSLTEKQLRDYGYGKYLVTK